MKLHYHLVLVSALVVLLEFTLRFSFGFCDALLYQSSDNYEYIAQPNQNRLRFGAHIHYNSYSQRNEEPDSARVKILGLGDSVIFGGTWMDQDSLATTLFSNETGMQMLNISAGSWGPDNCAAYLKEKGTFGAKAMILVCSSHDAYDVMSFTPVVGVYPTYPERQYRLAIVELMDRYLMPRVRSFFLKQKQRLDPDAAVVNKMSQKFVAKKSLLFNPGFDQLKNMADSLHIPFGVYLHAETGELMQGSYNEMGYEIMEWAEKNGVPLMKGMDRGENESMYKDMIHLNGKGQKHLAASLKVMVTELLLSKQ